MSLLLKLILAHLLGDFVLQFDAWVKDKQENKLKSPYLYLHVVIHFALILLITWNLNYWKLALFISLSHGIIDTCKLYISAKTTKQQWPFFTDQIAHLIIIVLACYWVNPAFIPQNFLTHINLKIVVAFLFLTLPVGIIIDKCMAGWAFKEDSAVSLPKAGKIIGIIERLLVLIFILLNHWEAIGFLITAKSVFRFNDLKASNRKLTEYMLIGTLLSFGMAIATGVLLILT